MKDGVHGQYLCISTHTSAVLVNFNYTSMAISWEQMLCVKMWLQQLENDCQPGTCGYLNMLLDFISTSLY